jgi:hypothetical protein
MKLSHGLVLGTAVLGAVGAAVAVGCGGGTSGTNTPVGGPPPRPTGPMTTITAEHNYAIHKLYLGDTDRMEVTSTTAWKSIGYNLDGLQTGPTDTNVCTPFMGANRAKSQTDGTNGIDNSFGANIIPLVMGFAPTPTKTVSDAINTGSFTVMADVVGFDDSTPATATGITGALLAGGVFGSLDGGKSMPGWDTNTHWPIVRELLDDPTKPPAQGAHVKFANAYQVKGTFVSGDPTTLQLHLSFGGQNLDISVSHAILTFDEMGKGGVTNGTIAGAIDTQSLLNAVQLVAGRIQKSFCSGSAFASIASEIQQASDIVIEADGTTVDNKSGVACNAISIGIGFDSTEIAVPAVADILPAAVAAGNPCEAGSGDDGGEDGGEDSGGGDSAGGDSGGGDAAAEAATDGGGGG